MTLFGFIVVAAVVLFAALVLLGLILADRHRRRHRARLNRLISGKPVMAACTTQRRLKTKPTTTGGRALGMVEGRIAQSGLKITVPALLMQVSLGVLGVYALAVVLLGISPLVAIPVALFVPMVAVHTFLNIAKGRYMTAFTNGLPEALDIFARGLRAGRPVSDSLAIVVDSSQGPVQLEFSRAHQEICMGTPLAESLGRLGQRVPTAEVTFFAVATALQSETGGNLIETMESLASQLRERRKLRKKARALSSEARASALILASLPFAVAALIAVLNGAYLAPLYADPRGQIMSVVAVATIGMGIFIMARMGKLNV